MNKFRAKPVLCEDGRFDSQLEHRRWQELKLLERAGEITNLRRQVRYKLNVNEFHICDYIADFCFTENGVEIVEDVKSKVTVALPTYRIKKALMAACLGITVVEYPRRLDVTKSRKAA